MRVFVFVCGVCVAHDEGVSKLVISQGPSL